MDASTLLARTTQFLRDPQLAMDACRTLVESHPDDAAGDAARVTAQLVAAWTTIRARMPGDIPQQNTESYALRSSLAQRVTASAAPVLANGLVTSVRCRDTAKRASIRKFVDAAGDLDAQFLEPLFDEARREADALAAARSGAAAGGPSRDDVYRDADTYYQAFLDRDLDDALRGFEQMKRLDPLDPYPRNMIAAVFIQHGRSRDAVRELLYAFTLDPGYVHGAANLLNELASAHAHAAALEIARHYRRRRRPDADGAETAIDLFEQFSSLTLQGLACAAAQVSAADFDANASSVLDELPIKPRPWLPTSDPFAAANESRL